MVNRIQNCRDRDARTWLSPRLCPVLAYFFLKMCKHLFKEEISGLDFEFWISIFTLDICEALDKFLKLFNKILEDTFVSIQDGM